MEELKNLSNKSEIRAFLRGCRLVVYASAAGIVPRIPDRVNAVVHKRGQDFLFPLAEN